MGEYTSETLYRNIAGAGNVFTGGEQVWNQEKIREYFNNIFDQLKVFNDGFEAFYKDLMKFVDDDKHTGDEAEASKNFISNDFSLIAIDCLRAAQILQGKMQGPGFEESVALLEDFLLDVDEEDNAIISKEKIDKVIVDFANYNKTFTENSAEIKTKRDAAQEIVAKCGSVTSITTLDDPDASTTKTSFDDLVSEDGDSGMVPTFEKNFLNFIDEHKDDFTGTEFVSLIESINTNLNRIKDGLGNGDFDPDNYTDKLSNVTYDNASDLEDYDAYVENYQKYIKGQVPMSQVYMYDPVNMNSGSFVKNIVDLKVGGNNRMQICRSYDSRTDHCGALGHGWILNYEEHLKKEKGSITMFYGDGKEGCFKKVSIGKEEVYLEVHGEPGTLKETDSGFRLTFDDNRYIDYDVEGYISAYGDNYGLQTTVDYDTFEQHVEGKIVKKVLPVKVTSKEGSFLKFTYDDNGLLIKVDDHAGRSFEYKYEDTADRYRLTSVVAANGNETRYEYSENGQIKSTIRADGVVSAVNDYDSIGRITHQVMPDGGEFNYSYDDKNHITTAIEPNGCKVEYISDEIGRHIGTRYPALNVEEKFTYNERGLRTSHTDKRGYTTRYFYDNRGHLTGIVGPEGLHEFYTYDSEGKMTSKKDSEGNVTKFKYDLDGNLYSVINPLGEKVRFYYEDGKVVSIRDAEDKRTNITYDKLGNIASVTDQNGVTIKYECDSLGRVIATEDAEGNRTSYDIGVDDNIRRVIDPEGNITSYDYDKLGNVVSITNPDGTRKVWEYNAIGKPSAITDEDNRTTRVYYNKSALEERVVLPNNGNICYEYDLLGNLTKVTDPDGNSTSYSYDKGGNVLSVQRGDSDESITVLAYSYDARGRVKSETDGNGNITSYEYDANGNVLKVTGPNEATTSYEYDKLGRVISSMDALGRESSFAYDKNGNLLRSIDPSGKIVENVYDNDRLVKVIERSGDEAIDLISYEYDRVGRISSETQADGLRIEYKYTKAGKISCLNGSNGRTITYKYDPNGRVVEIDDSGKVTKHTYTGTGKLKSVTDALGNRTEYTYNELDLLSKVERFGDESEKDNLEEGSFPKADKNGHVTTYSYGLSGKLIAVTDSLGQKDTYSYDCLGNLKSHIDRDGYETVYTRDNNGNVTGINYADGNSVKMKYNALNILQEVKDHLGLTQIESDILGRTVSVTDYKGRKVGYEYGSLDQQTAIIYPDGRRAEYSYDSFGRLKSLNEIKDNASNGVVTYSYDAIGRLSKKSLPNGVDTNFEYYQGGLIKSMTSTDNQGILDQYLYKYDKSSLVTDIVRDRRGLDSVSGSYHYEYDGLGRLTKSTLNGNLKTEYKYDAYGNRIQMTEADATTSYEYDALDRLTRSIVRDSSNNETSNIYSYDRRGNQVALTSGDIIKKTFKYDAMGKMTQATDSEKGDISYTYNGLGFRVESKRPEETIEYLCDISKDYYNLLERTVNGETESFIYDNNVVSMNRGGNNYYYLQDELGSTMYLTGTDGLTVNAYAYDDFGRRVDPFTGKLRKRLCNNNKSHAYTKNGNIIQPFAFTGYQEDEVSELNFAQARYYDPNAGRFNGEDKVRGFVETPETLNHYEYCWNNPISFADRDGNLPDWMNKAGSALKSAAKATGQFLYDNRKTIAKVAVGVAVGAACVVAAPVVASAAAAAVAATGVSATVGTIATTAVIGAGFSGITSFANQAIDNDGDLSKVNYKKVALDTVVGGVKGALGGAVGLLGAGAFGAGKLASFAATNGGKFVLKLGYNAVVDVASDFAKAKLIDQKYYGGKEVLKSLATSAFSTTAGHFLGKLYDKVPIGKWISGRYNVDFDLNKPGNLYSAYTDFINAQSMAGVYKYPVEEARGRLEDIIASYIANNFLNYDRGVIQKAVQSEFGLGYSDLVDAACKKIFGTGYEYACE